eukprot:1826-Heterococcus_DN1.PRE.3
MLVAALCLLAAFASADGKPISDPVCASLVLCGSKTTAVACSKVSGQEIECVNFNDGIEAAKALCGARNNCFCNRPYAYVTAVNGDLSGCYLKSQICFEKANIVGVCDATEADTCTKQGSSFVCSSNEDPEPAISV